MIKKDNTGIYIHLPYCIQLCHYCDFKKKLITETSKVFREKYQFSLLSEIKTSLMLLKDSHSFKTLYFGGGTPSLYPIEWIEEIFVLLGKYVPLESLIEVTMEVDPKTIRYHSLKKLKSLGVNRISLGAQSFSNRILKMLNRYHEVEDIYKCYADCRKVGFKNISLDLIYGVPEQTIDDVENDINSVSTLKPNHVSLYNLTIARGTRFSKDKNLLKFPNENQQIEFFERTFEAFAKLNLFQYEISNFSQKNYFSRHNYNCWQMAPYFGYGLGASSFDGDYRWQNTVSFDKYCSRIEKKKHARNSKIKLNNRIKCQESMMLALRTVKGLDIERFKRQYADIFETLFKKIMNETTKNFLTVEACHITLTRKGQLLSNEIFEYLFD